MEAAESLLRPYRFSRAEYHAIADALDPAFRYELLDGTIYARSPAKPPHAGVVTYFENRLAPFVGRRLIRAEKTLEIEPSGSPEPDIAVLRFRADYYKASHPNRSDALLVIEVGDTERNPHEKMRGYMRDGRIPLAWRADIPGRRLEIWTPADTEKPRELLRGDDRFAFEGVAFVVNEVFEGIA
jgi:Uma2 family endonuclease